MSIAYSQSVIPIEPEASSAESNLRVMVVDDERPSRERLKRFLRRTADVQLIAECASGPEAVTAIRQLAPDVVFLDVNMPEMDGFGVLNSLKGVHAPAIIFVTAHDRFALRAFEIDAVDYLLKPFNEQRLQAALRRVRSRLRPNGGRLVAPQSDADDPEPSLKPLDRITVRSSGRVILIKTSDIDWISAADNYVELHFHGKTHLLRITISALAERLPRPQFTRISRSILVNLDRVTEIHSRSHGDYFLVLQGGASLAGSRNYRAGMENLLTHL
jgi:two-component system, LytTR family, response regulator